MNYYPLQLLHTQFESGNKIYSKFLSTIERSSKFQCISFKKVLDIKNKLRHSSRTNTNGKLLATLLRNYNLFIINYITVMGKKDSQSHITFSSKNFQFSSSGIDSVIINYVPAVSRFQRTLYVSECLWAKRAHSHVVIEFKLCENFLDNTSPYARQPTKNPVVCMNNPEIVKN
eukprot:snap_masked-scaffold_24-processed-gene-4.22-mRNA-1 protein AED:1.00 eAED:1.00 QI:0/0/0/0/1/1/2/0/172